MLIDLGSYNNYYASDLTTTFPINGKFSEKQKDIYRIVLQCFDNAINNIDNHFHKLHEETEKIILKGLVDLNILKGDVDDLFS